MKRRRLFSALVIGHRAGEVTLEPARGADETTIDRQGNVVGQGRHPTAVLWANLGDRLILCGPTIEETTLHAVVGITPDGAQLRCERLVGELAATTDRVRVLLVRQAKTPARRAA